MTVRRAPRVCSVCGERLALTRLGCEECGSELSGRFDACAFCALSSDELELLTVFLRSRGNMKELERHLAVSYPTARLRFDALLQTLGIEPAAPPAARTDVLDALARGEIGVDEALKRLS